MIPRIPAITGLKAGGILVGDAALASRIKVVCLADYAASANELLPTISSKAEINGQTSHARRAYRPMSDAVKTKTSPFERCKYTNKFTYRNLSALLSSSHPSRAWQWSIADASPSPDDSPNRRQNTFLSAKESQPCCGPPCRNIL